MLAIDGAFPDKAIVMAGGRNISMAYYGIKGDGSVDNHVYRDMEVVLKPGPDDSFAKSTVGDVATIYYSLIFLHNGNRLLEPIYQPSESDIVSYDPYERVRVNAQQGLTKLKNLSKISQRLNDMTAYMNTGFHDSKVMLAHELGNLTSTNVVADA